MAKTNIIDGKLDGSNPSTDTMKGTDGRDIYVFQKGHGLDQIVNFQFGTDKIDLSTFGHEFTWEELQKCISHVKEPIYGGYMLQIDLTEYGGGKITFRQEADGDRPNYYGVQGKLSENDFILSRNDMSEDVELSGGGGRDLLHGYGGDDVLKGGGGNDMITGQAGDDRIIGGTGNDWLFGGNAAYPGVTGTGRDTFVFAPGHGHDTIADFNHGEDKIDLSAFSGVTGFSDLTVKQDGDNVVIDLSKHGGGSISLSYTDLDDVDAADFVFHDDDGM